jgi:membrane protein
MPGISMIYGAFATLPILLLWIYLGWLIVLFGAVIAAYAPSLQMHLAPPSDAPGQRFALALALLRELQRARTVPPHGSTLAQLSAAMRLDPLQVEALLEPLMRLGWVGRLDEDAGRRHLLLCDPALTPAEPLIDQLLLAPDPRTRAFRQRAGLAQCTLADLMAP